MTIKILDRGSKVVHLLDRYIGIPVVWFLGLLRKAKNKELSLNNSKKIAFLKTNGIGDTVLLSAAIKDLREKYHDVKLTLFVGENNYEIATILPGVDEVIKLPIKNPIRTIKKIRKKGNYDLWIDFGPWPRINALITYFAMANYKIGFNTKGQYRHYVYDVSIKHDSTIHECFNYKNLLKPIGVEGANLPSLLVAPHNKAESDKIIILHLFPSGLKSHLKEWPETNWVMLIKYFIDKGFKIYLTGANKDRHRAISLKKMLKHNDDVFVVAGEYTLKQTVALLARSILIISVNTGIMHIASALGINVISLNGPTSAKRWGPLNKNSISVNSNLSCSPCLNLGFEYGCNNNNCMASISVETVIDAANKLLLTKK